MKEAVMIATQIATFILVLGVFMRVDKICKKIKCDEEPQQEEAASIEMKLD